MAAVAVGANFDTVMATLALALATTIFAVCGCCGACLLCARKPVSVWSTPRTMLLNAAAFTWIILQFTAVDAALEATCAGAFAGQAVCECIVTLALHSERSTLGKWVSPSHAARRMLLPGLICASSASLIWFVTHTASWDVDTCELTGTGRVLGGLVWGSHFVILTLYELWLGWRSPIYRREAWGYRAAILVIIAVAVYITVTASAGVDALPPVILVFWLELVVVFFVILGGAGVVFSYCMQCCARRAGHTVVFSRATAPLINFEIPREVWVAPGTDDTADATFCRALIIASHLRDGMQLNDFWSWLRRREPCLGMLLQELGHYYLKKRNPLGVANRLLEVYGTYPGSKKTGAAGPTPTDPTAALKWPQLAFFKKATSGCCKDTTGIDMYLYVGPKPASEPELALPGRYPTPPEGTYAAVTAFAFNMGTEATLRRVSAAFRDIPTFSRSPQQCREYIMALTAFAFTRIAVVHWGEYWDTWCPQTPAAPGGADGEGLLPETVDGGKARQMRPFHESESEEDEATGLTGGAAAPPPPPQQPKGSKAV